MVGASTLTVLRLLADAGTLALDCRNLTARQLLTKLVEVDEPWSFVGCKEKPKRAGEGGTETLGS